MDFKKLLMDSGAIIPVLPFALSETQCRKVFRKSAMDGLKATLHSFTVGIAYAELNFRIERSNSFTHCYC